MALADLPVWTLPANWKGGCLERLEWRTSVLRSRRGAEQRLALRQAPRRALEVSFLLHRQDRTLFDLSVHRVGSGEWYLPLFHHTQRLGAALVAGATAIPLGTYGRGFVAPGAALLYASPAVYEAVEIAGLDSTSLTLAAPLAAGWPEGTRLLPLRRGRLAEQPSVRQLTDTTGTAEVRFELTEPDDFPALAMPVTYRDFPVLTLAPDRAEDLETAYERAIAELDNGSGRKHLADAAPDITITTQQHAWFLHGVQEHAEFYGLLYTLRGRLKALWLPTFAADLELLEADGGAGITVAWCGYTAFGGPRVGREDIRIELRDGTSLYRRITAAAEDGDGNEFLTLSSALGTPLEPAAVRRISWMTLSRLDQDGVEIAHETDLEGVARVTAAFRAAPDLRDAEAWTPLAPTGVAKRPFGCIPSQCGNPDLLTEFLMYPREGTFPYTPSIGGPNAYYVHKTDQFYRVANFGGNWTEGLAAAWTEYLATYFPWYGAPGAIVHDIIEPAAIALVDPEETNAGAELCGFLPLTVFELHYNYSLFPSMTHQWFWWSLQFIALNGPRTTLTVQDFRAEIWTSDGLTRLTEIRGYFNIRNAGDRSLYLTNLGQFGEYSGGEMRPYDPPVPDPMPFHLIPDEGAGSAGEIAGAYMVRVFKGH
jgi:hypothetical protein